ncbi:MAG TPA: hypothetical protein VMM17_09850 [Gemmatimonadaceae bacterium]|nr:hypothetical protein [Gemmatimonadaceae bacterium]
MDLRNSTAWSRLAPWAGIAFVVLLVAGFATFPGTPEYDEPDAWQAFWADGDNRIQALIAGYLIILSSFAFLWFGRALAARLQPEDGVRDALGSISEAAATLFPAFVLIFVIVGISIPASVEFGDAPVPGTAELAIQMDQLAFGLLLIGGSLSAGVLTGAVSELARRRRALPQWLVWAGFAVAALQVLGVMFFPFLLILHWTLVTSIVLLLRARSASAPAAAPTTT